MNLLITLLSILFIFIIGFIVTRAYFSFEKAKNISESAFAFGLGVGFITFQLFIYSWIGIDWRKEFIIFPWIIISLFLLIKYRDRFKIKLTKVKLGKIEKLLILLISISILYTFFQGQIRPAMTWDSWSIWLLESKAFFIDGKIDPKTLSEFLSDYPPLYKLFGSFIYIILGEVDDTTVLLTSFFFYLFTGIQMFRIVKNRSGLRAGLIAFFATVTVQNMVRHGGRIEAGQADLPLAFYCFMSTCLLLEYFRNQSLKILIALSIFLGFISLVKFEGIPFNLAIMFILFVDIYQKKIYKYFPFVFLWSVFFIAWKIFGKLNEAESFYLTGHGFVINFDKTLHSFSGTFKEFLNIKTWNLTWMIYIYSILVLGIKNSKELLTLNFIIISQISVYLMIYIFTGNNNPESSAQRLLLHLFPIVLLYIFIQSEKFSKLINK